MDKFAPPIATLLLPFDKGVFDMPSSAFLLRAEAAPELTPWADVLTCEQSFKPAYDRLVQAGFNAVQCLEGGFPLGMVLTGKHKVENRALIARGLAALPAGGTLLVCGLNALGIASLEKEAAKVLGVQGVLSKHQARVFWISRSADPLPEAVEAWRAAAQPKAVDETGLVARAGCFSAERADAGSLCLLRALPDSVQGRVADLGAGWGLLAADVLTRFAAVTQVDCYEAEALALADARANLAAFGERASFHWVDVAADMPKVEPYDWIIANPPFHEGGKADPGIGQAFITAAWKAVRRRGKFVLVANRHLPYEAELRKRFREVTLLAEDKGFKVYLSSNRHDK